MADPAWPPRASASSETSGAARALWSPGFLALLATQFLVTLNGNTFRWLVVPIGKNQVGSDVALAASSVVFLLPFVLLSVPAGYLADRFSKRTVIVWCKAAEVAVVALGVAAIVLGSLWWLLLVSMALLACQAAIFSPSKLGSIPEIVPAESISFANGVFGLATMVALILGTVLGGYLYEQTTAPAGLVAHGGDLLPGQYRWWLSASVLLGVSVVGWAASLGIGRLGPADPARPIPRNPVGQAARDLGELISRRPLFLAAVASALFWSLWQVTQLNADKLAWRELFGESQQHVCLLLAVLMLGAGAGSLLAGIWSAGRVELGMIPFGAAGITASCLLLVVLPQGTGEPGSSASFWASFWLFALGVASGLFDIPLQAFLQHRSPVQSRGTILAAYNFLTYSGMLLAAGLFWLLADVLGWSARQIFLLVGFGALAVLLVVLWLLLASTIRLLLATLLRIMYRIRTLGMENVPETGGAVLVANHVSWVDGLLLPYILRRPIRMIAWAEFLKHPWVNWFTRAMGVIPIGSTRKSVVQSIRAAREALRRGDLIGIFPEGSITRTGQLQEFQPGFLSILKDADAPVIPVYLDGLWGSIFSFEGGRFFWKWPRRWPYPIAIYFGRPILHVDSAFQARQAVQELAVQAMKNREPQRVVPPRVFLRVCRARMRRLKVADSTHVELTGVGLLTRTLILRRLLARRVLAADEARVGVLLPPSVGGVVVNAALALDRRVAVNLNYTVSSEVMNLCIAQANIRHVLTTRKMRERFPLTIDAELVYVEDFKDQARWSDKLAAAAQAWLWPIWLLERRFGLHGIDPDDLLTIIFTSGSTGKPKGVMLTHRNIGSNVEAFNQVLRLHKDDVVVGILPFFHSFGYTTTLWLALMLDPAVVYHYSPLEPRQVGALCARYRGTILIATPTFLRSYVRRCAPEEFASLDAVVTGAEKLPPELATAFERQFGVRPVEGYGTTELAPVVSCNIPANRSVDGSDRDCREGTVGRPLPGISAKVVDLDTGEDLGPDRSGMLLIKGPNVMKGYLDQPELTAQVIRDGWYVTGDVAVIDNDGFIRITGRESRFSKIGGEMVPHLGVEEALIKVLSLGEDDVKVAVTGVPDPKKGERLVVLHTGLPTAPEQLCRDLGRSGLPPLWVPSPDSFIQVEQIPVLGTGKLDLKQVKELALAKFRPQE